MDKISFVLPLKINAHQLGSDLQRVKKILFPSLIKFFPINQIDRFLIIVPNRELMEIRREIQAFRGKLPVTVISEEVVLAKISGWKIHFMIQRMQRLLKEIDYRVSRGRLLARLKRTKGWGDVSGWFKQQMLKMFAVKFIETGYYMTLDADVCLTRVVDYESLFPEGKAVYAVDCA